jgi:hypothetical protein
MGGNGVGFHDKIGSTHEFGIALNLARVDCQFFDYPELRYVKSIG